MVKSKFLLKYINVITLCCVVVVVTIAYYYSTTIKWKHKDAVKMYNIIKNKYGTPNIIDFSKGGLAIWTEKQLSDTCFKRIELLDESIPHCVPKPHRDFLYSYVNYEIPNSKILDVLSLSGSVSYDPLKKLLRARCGSEEANIATLYLAVAIGNNRISISDIHHNKLYKKTIVSTGNPQNVQIYYEKLCNYLKNQPGNPNWTGFFPLAFPDGCCPGYDPKLNACGIEQFVEYNGHGDDTLQDHLAGKITDHSTEDHLADKSDKSEESGGNSSSPVIV